MRDTRWWKIDSCIECGRYGRCKLRRERKNGEPIHPRCALWHVGDIPEVKALVKAAREHSGGAMKLGTLANLRAALKPFEEGK